MPRLSHHNIRCGGLKYCAEQQKNFLTHALDKLKSEPRMMFNENFEHLKKLIKTKIQFAFLQIVCQSSNWFLQQVHPWASETAVMLIVISRRQLPTICESGLDPILVLIYLGLVIITRINITHVRPALSLMMRWGSHGSLTAITSDTGPGLRWETYYFSLTSH